MSKESDREYYLKNREKKIQQAKDYILAHKEETKQYQEEYRKSHKEETKAYTQKRIKDKSRMRITYGITLEDWQAMFDKQEGKCVICGVHQSEINRVLCVDHNHVTGKVRGLLCYHCNAGLGNFGDSAESLIKAAQYLKGE